MGKPFRTDQTERLTSMLGYIRSDTKIAAFLDIPVEDVVAARRRHDDHSEMADPRYRRGLAVRMDAPAFLSPDAVPVGRDYGADAKIRSGTSRLLIALNKAVENQARLWGVTPDVAGLLLSASPAAREEYLRRKG